jgi:hypothetical protein
MKTKFSQIIASIGTVILFSFMTTANLKATNIILKHQLTSSAVNDDLEKAKKAGKVVFLIITGKGTVNVSKAVTLTKEASVKVKNTTTVQLNRDDAANSEIVSKFRIQAVPLPYILIISAKGLPVAGVDPAQATADDLVKAIPSPCQDAVFVGLNEKKPVFLIISKKGYTDKISVVSTTKTAIQKIASKPEIVEIDFDDKSEADFLKQLGITTMNGLTVTVLINAAGQITDKLLGVQNVDRLVSLATKPPQSSGCKPGACGSNKSGCK